MLEKFYHEEHSCDLCIVGGGLSGTIAALAAARHGARVVLIQDRPMLGGNASSEIRMWVRGAKGIYNREGGILAEFEEENIYRNPTLAHTVWDSVLFGKVKAEKNITLLLNASCLDAETENGAIKSVTAWQLTTYKVHKIYADYFADCSGDSVLAPLTGALHRIGREGRAEYKETIGPETADGKTMGMSLLLQARETDHPVPFIPPSWANVYEKDEDFALIPYVEVQHSTFRDHTIGTSGCNLWWMELGGEGPAILNTEETRDELLKVVFGIWDHIKNKGDHGFANWELEWVGFLPGKRESVRYVGAHVLTENDVLAGGKFPDTVAYGGWPMDDHNPKGFLARPPHDAPSVLHPAPSPYGIPYRSLYSANIKNLFFAGRNISATHAAISSTRVMATCSLLGQAMGTAAALCVRDGILPSELTGERVGELQQALLRDGVFLPGVPRACNTLLTEARFALSDDQKTVLLNGVDRPRSEEEQNRVSIPKGESLCFTFSSPCEVGDVRLWLDPDYSRMSVSPNKKMRWFAQRLNTGADFVPMKVAATIAKSFTVYADGKPIYEVTDNYHSLVTLPVRQSVREIRIVFHETHGAQDVGIFGIDVLEM